MGKMHPDVSCNILLPTRTYNLIAMWHVQLRIYTDHNWVLFAIGY